MAKNGLWNAVFVRVIRWSVSPWTDGRVRIFVWFGVHRVVRVGIGVHLSHTNPSMLTQARALPATPPIRIWLPAGWLSPSSASFCCSMKPPSHPELSHARQQVVAASASIDPTVTAGRFRLFQTANGKPIC